VVVNGNGRVTALWAEKPTRTDSSHCSVRVAHDKLGSTWSRPKALTTECALHTSLTVDGQGYLVAAWQSLDAKLPRYAIKVPGQEWGPPATVPHAQNLEVRDLATNKAGDSTLVLAGDGRDKIGVYVVQRHRASGWSDPVRISRVEPRVGTLVTESPKGDVTVIWSAARKRIRTATSPAGGAWTKVRRLGRGEPSRIAYDRRRVLAVWTSPRGSTMFATKPARAGWKGAMNLSGTSKGNQHPDVSADRRGHVTVVWSNFYTGDIRARTRGKNGRWSAIQTVTAKGYSTSAFTDANPQGGTWIAWRTRRHDHRFRAKASRQH
jgi:hypothetical protein